LPGSPIPEGGMSARQNHCRNGYFRDRKCWCSQTRSELLPFRCRRCGWRRRSLRRSPRHRSLRLSARTSESRCRCSAKRPARKHRRDTHKPLRGRFFPHPRNSARRQPPDSRRWLGTPEERPAGSGFALRCRHPCRSQRNGPCRNPRRTPARMPLCRWASISSKCSCSAGRQPAYCLRTPVHPTPRNHPCTALIPPC
jgi:hypothetical protein